MNTATEPPDAFADRDLLVAERSPDVIREVLGRMLRAGASPEQLLADVPTLSERQVRDAMRKN